MNDKYTTYLLERKAELDKFKPESDSSVFSKRIRSNKNKFDLSQTEATKIFIRVFEDFRYVQIVKLLIGLDEYTEGFITRKDLILELRIRSDLASLILRGLRELGIVKKRKTAGKREVRYSIDSERYQDLKNHYDFLVKTLGFEKAA